MNSFIFMIIDLFLYAGFDAVPYYILKNVNNSVFLPNTHFLSLILFSCYGFWRSCLDADTNRFTDVGGVIYVQVM